MRPYNHDIYLNGYKAVTFEGPLRLGTYDSYGNERIRVLCSPEWDGLTIVATFKAASAVEVLVDADGMLDVPPEATATQQAAAGRCALTFVGTGEGRQTISCTTYYLVQDHATVGNVTPDPTPDKWQQFVDQVAADRTGAAAAAKEAARNAQDAKTAESNAKDSADNAAASATAAAESAQAAAKSAEAAARSAAKAQGSADAAANSAETAKTAETGAGSNAAAAKNSADRASASAAAAKESQAAAKTSQDAASASASTASSKATAAGNSAVAAATSEKNAAASSAAAKTAQSAAETAKSRAESAKTAADSSAKAAASSASAANGAASTATTQATAAKSSADNAASSATAAKSSETNAGLSATAAANAEAAAKQAQNAAETAKADAETAKTAAGNSADAAANSAADAKKTLESIPADYSALSGKVDKNTSGISELKEDIDDLKNIKTCKNILFKGTTNIVDGEFVDLDGTVTSASSYMHTERIAMPCGSKLFGIGKRTSDGYLETLSMRFVSAYINGRYNTYYGKANATEYECVYGDGVEVTVSVNKGIYTDFYLYVVSEDGESINPINETLKGKTVYGFGDSLVYGHYSKVGMLDMLCDNEGMIYKKYAVNGAKITGQWEILKQIILGDTEQPDFVIFDGGTNDAFTSSPIGEFSEEYTSQGYDTFIGAFDTVCNNIRVKYPNAKIIYVSPHKMPTSSFEIQKTIHDMALKVCDKYSISVVDIYSQGQINTNIETMKNEWSYNTEGATSGGNGTHLTGEGYYKFYAPMIKAKMIELLD